MIPNLSIGQDYKLRIPLNDKSKVTNSINVTSKGFDYVASCCWERLE